MMKYLYAGMIFASAIQGFFWCFNIPYNSMLQVTTWFIGLFLAIVIFGIPKDDKPKESDPWWFKNHDR